MRFFKLMTVVLSLSISSLVFASSNQSNKVPGELLVKLSANSNFLGQLNSFVGDTEIKVTNVTNNILKIKAKTSEEAQKILEKFTDDSSIEYIQPNFIYRSFNSQPVNQLFINDPKLSAQWGFKNVKVERAWSSSKSKGSKSLVVAVIDTGVDYNHEDLKNNIWINENEIPGNGIDDDENGYIDDVKGWDFALNKNDPMDVMSQPRFSGNPGHGTHCAGVIGAVSGNGKGISGVAPGVRLMALRFITEKGQGTSEGAMKALKYAIDNGAKVINNSWGGESDSGEEDKILKEVIAYGESKDVLMIFAAGNGRNGVGFSNDTDSKPMVPASFDHDNIISVAAIDVNNALGSFSNFGVRTVDIAAPGVKIMSTVPNNQYEDQILIFGFPLAPWSGTSMAAPHVAGVAALVRSVRPELSFSEVKKVILDSANPVSSLSDKVLTGGTLDAEKAMTSIVSSH